jgi:catechol 2,3-dioxygenase-like lactoylglutathione lyase family enzyme
MPGATVTEDRGAAPGCSRADRSATLAVISRDRTAPMSSIPARLSIVTLGVREFHRARDFYRSLGWEEASTSGEPWACFRTAGALLALFPVDDLAVDAAAPTPRSAAQFGGFTLVVMVETPALVDRTLEAARAAGATVVKEASDAFGGRSGYFADPEGNRWEVAWLPGARFDERGALLDV